MIVIREDNNLKAQLEAILFAAGDPVPAGRISMVLGVEEEDVLGCARAMDQEYISEGRGIRLVRVGGSLQLCSAPEHSTIIARTLESRRPPRLSQPALEALAVVAYFQPVTRAYIEKIRGVDSSYTVGVLQERGLIEACGRLDVPGRPTIYKTSDVFLRTMGIESLDELPELPTTSSDEGLEALQSAIDALKGEDSGQLEISEDGVLPGETDEAAEDTADDTDTGDEPSETDGE